MKVYIQWDESKTLCSLDWTFYALAVVVLLTLKTHQNLAVHVQPVGEEEATVRVAAEVETDP